MLNRYGVEVNDLGAGSMVLFESTANGTQPGLVLDRLDSIRTGVPFFTVLCGGVALLVPGADIRVNRGSTVDTVNTADNWLSALFPSASAQT